MSRYLDSDKIIRTVEALGNRIEERFPSSGLSRVCQELRVIAHIIDLHQLTEDPSKLYQPILLTPASPKNELSASELGRYLDYCSALKDVGIGSRLHDTTSASSGGRRFS